LPPYPALSALENFVSRFIRPLAFASFLAAAAVTPARAQTTRTTAPELHITQRNVSAQAESPGGTPRTETRPGDVIRYTLTFTNPGTQPLRDVAISDPIPARMRIVLGSTRSSRGDARLEFSIDSGKTWGEEPTETVIANGRQVARPVSPGRYTNLRWVLTKPVAAKETVTAEFSARVGG
jgi:uncharacterized repeat protein (TIGR01451 family)